MPLRPYLQHRDKKGTPPQAGGHYDYGEDNLHMIDDDESKLDAPDDDDDVPDEHEQTVSSTELGKSLRRRDERANGLISIPIAVLMMVVYAVMLSDHYNMDSINKVNSGLTYLLENDADGAAMAFEEIIMC